MREIRLKNIKKRFEGELILDGINLTIPSGSFFALLGPSGSGKTTLLRLIGGFEKADGGTIHLGSTNITNIPINERRVNTVFQNYALFPHFNVFDNVAYSLNLKNVSKDIVEQKVIKVLKAVHLEKQIYKSIDQLSGGQQQRVALARAIVNEPDVLLLDEPLAALDMALREKMLVELIDLQDQIKTTFVYVTHDQFEALTVADQLAIMNSDGEIEQVGTPKEIYEFPASSFVASFVGKTNILKGTIVQDSKKIEIEDLGVFDILVPQAKPWVNDGIQVLMSIRPEKIEISKTELAGFANHLTGTVDSIVYHGRSTQYLIKLKDGTILHVFEQNEEHFPQEIIDYDDVVHMYWQKENVVLLEK
ncbi:ABC transporter ATP-binding protein [bacterium]|nr:ABC transporter ATP-binding protein [bacterium]